MTTQTDYDDYETAMAPPGDFVEAYKKLKSLHVALKAGGARPTGGKLDKDPGPRGAGIKKLEGKVNKYL